MNRTFSPNRESGSGINFSHILAGLTLATVLAATGYAVLTSFRVTKLQSEMSALNNAVASPLGLGANFSRITVRHVEEDGTRLRPPAFIVSSEVPGISESPGISIENPNPAGSSVIYYCIDHGDWEKYEGGRIPIEVDSILNARAVSNLPGLANSLEVEETFSVRD